MKTILIIGSNGQLGSELQGLANSISWATIHFVDFPEIDITNSNQVEETIQSVKPDYVINCAAYTAVDKAEEERELAFRVNAEGAKHIASACTKVGAKLVHVSTDYVFDGTNHTPYTEQDQVKPNSVYGESKLKGEQEVLQSDCPSIVIRTSWLYSTFGNNFMKTMVRLGKERESLGVIFDQIGTPTYARHLAQAIAEILTKVSEQNHAFVEGVYHFSNEGVCSWYDFTTAIHNIYGGITCQVNPIETTDYPTAAKRPAYSVLNKNKIKSTYDIKVSNWWYGLKECIETYKED